MSVAAKNFVRQNGFADADDAACAHRFPALMFQPRVIAVVVVAGVAFQTWQVFVLLSAILCWNVMLPRLNPFDQLHNRFSAAPKGLPPLPPAAGPRRFAQGMAATSTLGVGVCLRSGFLAGALVFEAIVGVALTMLLVGRLCLGSYLFHVLRGKVAFANETLPWARR